MGKVTKKKEDKLNYKTFKKAYKTPGQTEQFCKGEVVQHSYGASTICGHSWGYGDEQSPCPNGILPKVEALLIKETKHHSSVFDL